MTDRMLFGPPLSESKKRLLNVLAERALARGRKPTAREKLNNLANALIGIETMGRAAMTAENKLVKLSLIDDPESHRVDVFIEDGDSFGLQQRSVPGRKHDYILLSRTQAEQLSKMLIDFLAS